MIIGLRMWNDNNCYYTQDNNSFEALLTKYIRRYEKQKGNIFKKKQYETCGPTAAMNIIASIGLRFDLLLRRTTFNDMVSVDLNKYIQIEDLITLYMNNPNNYKRLEKNNTFDAGFWIGNEVAAFYVDMIQTLFKIDCYISWSKFNIDNVVNRLSLNTGCMVCLKKPGHYIAIVAYDHDTEEIIYNDPWQNNYYPKNLRGTSGFNRRISLEVLEKNLQDLQIYIG